jgi:tetratricopeptide (TPR) repeat protein
MPKNGTTDIPHVSVTDHFIRKIPLNKLDSVRSIGATDIDKIRKFIGLACINNPAADNNSRGLAFINYFEKFDPKPYLLDSAKQYFKSEDKVAVTKNFSALIRLAYLQNDYQQILKYAEQIDNPIDLLPKQHFILDNSWTSYRIGEAYNAFGNKQRAELFYQHAIDIAPYVLDFRNKLAQVQFDQKKYDQARKNFEFIISENPKYSSAYVSLGFLILMTERNPDKADQYYDKALALDPDNEQALLNKVGIFILRNEPKQAKETLNKVLSINPHNQKAKELIQHL